MRKKLQSEFVRVVRLAGLVTLVVGAMAVQAAVAQTGYVVQDLGALAGDTSSVAWAINANGDVVGWSTGQSGTRAFVYTNAGGMVALPSLPDRPRSVARDINDAGLVVGSANMGGTDLGHAVLWSGGSAQDLGTLGTGLYSEAWGVNNLGQVVGWSFTNGGSGLSGVHGFLHTAAQGLVDLTPDSDTGYALDINDAGQVTGYKTAFGGYHAFRWQEGSFVDLGVLPGFAHSFGWAVGTTGEVVGSLTSDSGNTEHFFRYRDGTGIQDLGGVGEHNVALGINGSGTVVGTKGNSLKRAVRYSDAAGLLDLNTLIDPSLGWVLLGAHDVNDTGQIVGYGFNNFTGLTHAVRLQPTSTPPAACTFHCLRSTGIVLRAAPRRHGLKGVVSITDENGAPVPGTLVLATWTQPDGSEHGQYAPTGPQGLATFTTSGPAGRYTLTIVNVQLSLYTFDPTHSVLSRSITVERPVWR
jgi:probable HAF family extracellular repeat protein